MTQSPPKPGQGALISHSVIVGDQTFRIRIPADQRARYDEIARLTEETFKTISSQALAGGARVWAMTAYQLATELLEARESSRTGAPDEDERIERMIRRIEAITLGDED